MGLLLKYSLTYGNVIAFPISAWLCEPLRNVSLGHKVRPLLLIFAFGGGFSCNPLTLPSSTPASLSLRTTEGALLPHLMSPNIAKRKFTPNNTKDLVLPMSYELILRGGDGGVLLGYL